MTPSIKYEYIFIFSWEILPGEARIRAYGHTEQPRTSNHTKYSQKDYASFIQNVCI